MRLTIAQRLRYWESRLRFCYVPAFEQRTAPWWRKLACWAACRFYVARRYLQGAHRVSAADPVCGSIEEPGLSISWGGMCPVQGDGYVDGRACYYRSRGESWEFCVAAPGKTHEEVYDLDAWSFGESPYIWPDGGYVTAAVSEACIRKSVALFRASKATRKAPGG